MVPTGTRPAALGPATQPAAFPVKLILMQKPGDELQIAGDNKAPSLIVTSPSGIGSMTLAPAANAWPAELPLHFRYAGDKPFTTLEGFTAQLLPAKAGDRPIALEFTRYRRRDVGGLFDFVLVTIPPSAGNRQLKLSWIDAYR